MTKRIGLGRGSSPIALTAPLALSLLAASCQVQTNLATAAGGSAGAIDAETGGTEATPGAGGTEATSGAGGTSSGAGGTILLPDAGGPGVPQGSGGTAQGGASMGFGGSDTRWKDNVLVIPDANGWVDGTTNLIGLTGNWFAYGDAYGEAVCVNVGMHPASDCSVVRTPDPIVGGFPNVDGVMCTEGATAVILPCAPDLRTEGCPANDYENMWGAGIGVTLNADSPEEGGAQRPWNALAYAVHGISFEIDAVPAVTKLRVEFQMPLTDVEAAELGLPPGSTSHQHAKGSPYWGATYDFHPSPVTAGVNRVLWNDVRHPVDDYAFDPSRILSIRFHAPAVYQGSAAKGEYAFCIKNLTFLRDDESSGGAGNTPEPCDDTSLETYCELWNCPPTIEAAIAEFNDGACSGLDVTVADGCGLITLRHAAGFSGEDYSYDSTTHELVGARHYNDVADDCGRYGVLVGVQPNVACSPDEDVCRVCRAGTPGATEPECMY